MVQTTNEKKLEILNRLVKEGQIDLMEALVLLETEKEYFPIINTPWPNPNPWRVEPYIYTTISGDDSITTTTFYSPDETSITRLNKSVLHTLNN